MVRVIYHWRVPAQNVQSFELAWSDATEAIKESTEGARGSMLLRSSSEPSAFLTIARWESVDDWRAFWGTDVPASMRLMHELAERLSVEVYDEIEDQTV